MTSCVVESAVVESGAAESKEVSSNAAENKEVSKGEKGKKSSRSKEECPTPAETAAKQKRQQAEKEKRAQSSKQHSAQGGRRQRTKKQNGGSWKKLDVDINFSKPNNSNSSNSSKRHKNAGKNKNKSQHKTKPKFRGGRYNDGCKHYHPELQLQDAVAQVEYFFSTQELSRNPFIRRHMDLRGYIPAAIIFNFPSVFHYGIPYHHLLAAVKDHSALLIVDEGNQTFRLKEHWQRWLYPNEDGTKGCAEWIICSESSSSSQEQPVMMDHASSHAHSSNNSSTSTHPCTDSETEST
uniref:HTH La-type RNA-binding domain-containing protein n=1 Tax=Ditylum brightwellii TaxID=49249 RepID=A0A7S4WDV7_9STRA